MKKTNKKTVTLNNTWEIQLPLYLDLYSKLNDEGKKEMQRQVKVIGALVDRMQKMRKEKENETK